MPAGVTKQAAMNSLAEFRKSDESMRDRLFVLQVWRKYDQETADKLARRKAGEFLDPDWQRCWKSGRRRWTARNVNVREKKRDTAADQNATKVAHPTTATTL